MAVLGVGNSLMLDFRSVIVPRFVYADYSSFADGAIADDAVAERIGRLADDLCVFGAALAPARSG